MQNLYRVSDITLRAHRAGGGRLVEALFTMRAARALHEARKHILVVHGFNVTLDDAIGSFDSFLENLARSGGVSHRSVLTVAWPGDELKRRMGPLRYRQSVAVAQACAPQLAHVLSALCSAGDAAQVIIVGHSLGCRLVIESKYGVDNGILRNSSQISLILMAAAVRVDAIDSGGPLNHAAHFPSFRAVMYSHTDGVLKYIFPIGEATSADVRRGGLPSAVGLSGFPMYGTWSSRLHMVGYSHGSYWNQPQTAVVVARFLGIPVATDLPTRQLSGRSLARDTL